MLAQLRRARFVRYVVIPALLVLVSGCHKWVDVKLGPRMPDRVRVTTSAARTDSTCPDRNRFEVHAPRVEPDGLHHRASHYRPIPLSRICSVEEEVSDPVATVFTVLGVLSVVFVAAAAIAICTDDFFDC